MLDGKDRMINKKTALIILAALMVIGLIIAAFYILKPKTGSLTPDANTIQEVTISTDRIDYDKGEVLNIIVKNGLDTRCNNGISCSNISGTSGDYCCIGIRIN